MSDSDQIMPGSQPVPGSQSKRTVQRADGTKFIMVDLNAASSQEVPSSSAISEYKASDDEEDEVSATPREFRSAPPTTTLKLPGCTQSCVQLSTHRDTTLDEFIICDSCSRQFSRSKEFKEEYLDHNCVRGAYFRRMLCEILPGYRELVTEFELKSPSPPSSQPGSSQPFSSQSSWDSDFSDSSQTTVIADSRNLHGFSGIRRFEPPRSSQQDLPEKDESGSPDSTPSSSPFYGKDEDDEDEDS